MSNGWQNILVIFCLHAFIVGFFPPIRRIRSRTGLMKFVLYQNVLSMSKNLSVERHVCSCILFGSVCYRWFPWYSRWYPLISINIRVEIHCYPRWFVCVIFETYSRTTSWCEKNKPGLSNMNKRFRKPFEFSF